MVGKLQYTGGILGFGVLVAFGFWVLLWGYGRFRMVKDSADWPTVQGTVLSSRISDSSGEKKARVTYHYTVDGTPYHAGRIGFAPFKDSGGRGSAETILARYPAGQAVNVYYSPTEPHETVLEPGDFSPFLPSLFLGGMMLCLSSACLVGIGLRALFGSQFEGSIRRASPALITAMISAAFYGAMVLASVNSACQEVFERVFGSPFGLSPLAASLFVNSLLGAFKIEMSASSWGRRV